MTIVVMIVRRATTAGRIGNDSKGTTTTLERAIRHLRPNKDLLASVEAAREVDHMKKDRLRKLFLRSKPNSLNFDEFTNFS